MEKCLKRIIEPWLFKMKIVFINKVNYIILMYNQ